MILKGAGKRLIIHKTMAKIKRLYKVMGWPLMVKNTILGIAKIGTAIYPKNQSTINIISSAPSIFIYILIF